MRYRTYINGKLTHSSKLKDIEQGLRWLNYAQADWSKNLMPQVLPGEFDPNNGSEVTRVNETELHVTTTGGHKLIFKIVE